MAEIGGVDHGEPLVDVAAPLFRLAADQVDALGLEEHRGQPPHQIGAARERLPVQLEAPAAGAVEGVFAETGAAVAGIGDVQRDVQVIATERDEFLAAGASPGAAEGGKIERLEQVALALAVAPDEDVHARREGEVRVGEVAESRQPGPTDAHGRTQSPARRSGISRQSRSPDASSTPKGSTRAALWESRRRNCTLSLRMFFRMSCK